MARTYTSGVVALARALSKYMTKYGAQLAAAFPSPEKELLLALKAACEAFLESDAQTIAKND